MPAQACDALSTRGFVILPPCFDAVALAALRAAYDRAYAEARPEDLRVRDSARLAELQRYDVVLDRCTRLPSLLSLVGQHLGESFTLRFFHGRTVLPEVPAQTLHFDLREAGTTLINFIIPLDDFTADNGATRIVPASHRRPPELAPREAEAVVVLAPAGACLVFDAALWHGHAANTTRAPRRSVQGGYVVFDCGGSR